MDNVVKLFNEEVSRMEAAHTELHNAISQAIMDYDQTMNEAMQVFTRAINQASLDFYNSQNPQPKD